MKAPKILPWIAHKNGISDQLALTLWCHAAEEAEEISGCCDSSDYFRLSINQFIELADEAGKQAKSPPLVCPPSISSLGWVLREQNRFWQVNLLATQKACRFWLPNRETVSTAQNWSTEHTVSRWLFPRRKQCLN